MTTTYDDNGGSTPNGSIKNFTFTFPYLKTEDVKVSLNGVTQATTKYTVNVGVSPTRIEFNNNSVDSTVQESDGSPKTGVIVRVYRDTDVDSAKAVFAAGSSIRAQNLNDNQDQVLYALQEEQNQPETLTDADINPAAEIQVSKLKDGIARQLLQTDAAGTGVEWSSNIDVPGTLDVTGAVDFDSNLNVDGTLTVAGVSTLTGNVTVGGTVDGRDVAADGSKLDGIETGATADQTNAEIRTAVEAASDSNVFTDADHTKLNAIENNATADQSNAEIRAAVEAATDSNVFTDGDHSKLNAIEDLADVTDATNVNAAGAVMNADTTTAAMQFVIDEDNMSSNLATKVPTQQSTKAYITATSQPLNANLTNLATIPPEITPILASGTILTTNIAELNMLDGKQINNTIDSSASNGGLPTSLAVNNRIVELVTEVGGFHPVANETSFPTTNPDINDGAGTIVSIKALTSAFTTGSGVTTHTFTNGAGSGNNVTITGLTASTTYPAGRGMLLETTTTSGNGSANPPRAYAYHRLTLDEAGVADAQAAVDDFDERYYGPLGSAPGTRPGGGSRVNGDMYFDTSSNKMKVWNNSATSWDDVATSASSFIATLSPAFDGSETEFTASSVPIDAQSCIISINGVIQKPNSGTSTPSEGYVQLANDKIKFATAPTTGADYFMVTLGNAVSIGTPSPNTVGASQLQSNAVTTAKILDQNVTLAKLEHGDGTSDGKFLRSNNGADPTWVAVSTADGTKMPLAGGTFTGDTLYNDSIKAKFGASSDLQIYHNGSTASVIDAKAGDYIYIYSDNLRLNTKTGTEKYLTGTLNGAVELYYDNSKKLETTTNGITVSGNYIGTDWIKLQTDNKGFYSGASDDFAFYHNGSTNIINGNYHPIELRHGAEVHIKCVDDGAVELYHNNSKKLETQSTGVQVFGNLQLDDSNQLNIGSSSDLILMHDGNNSYISTGGVGSLYIRTSTSENAIKCVKDAGVELYYDNVKQVRTTSTGLYLEDDKRIDFGDGADLQIYHDGSNSYIKDNGTGNLIIRNGNDDAIICNTDASVDLFHNNVKKFETTSGGINITGSVACSGGSSNNLSLPDDGKAKFGTGDDLQIFHNGTKNWIEGHNGDIGIALNSGNEYSAEFKTNGAVELFYDNSKKAETYSNGFKINGQLQCEGDVKFDNPDTAGRDIRWDSSDDTLEFSDNTKAGFGDGNDLQIYHDGTTNIIEGLDSNMTIRPKAGENGILLRNNGSVDLYYDDAKKFETTSTGINITDGIRLGGNNAANELDDWEEGTWTATSREGTLGAQAGCRYQKMGSLVWLRGEVYDFSQRSGTVDIGIEGLPFTPAENGYGSAVFYRVANTDDGHIATMANTSGRVQWLVSSQGGSSDWYYLDYEDLNHSGSKINFAVMYRTTA